MLDYFIFDEPSPMYQTLGWAVLVLFGLCVYFFVKYRVAEAEKARPASQIKRAPYTAQENVWTVPSVQAPQQAAAIVASTVDPVHTTAETVVSRTGICYGRRRTDAVANTPFPVLDTYQSSTDTVTSDSAGSSDSGSASCD